jgi:hypothetical protein
MDVADAEWFEVTQAGRLIMRSPLTRLPLSQRRSDARQVSAVPSFSLRLSWLGRRDSNPNNRVQSAVSYR